MRPVEGLARGEKILEVASRDSSARAKRYDGPRQRPSSSRKKSRGCIESFDSPSEATRRSGTSVAAVRLSPRGPVEGLARREEILEDTSRDSSARAKRPDGPRQRPSSRKKSRRCIESFDSPSEATRRSGTSVAAVRLSPRGPVEGLARREEILEDASRDSRARAKRPDPRSFFEK